MHQILAFLSDRLPGQIRCSEFTRALSLWDPGTLILRTMRESFRYGCSGRGRHPSDAGFVSPTLRLMYDSPNPPFFCKEKSRGPAVTPGYIGRGPCSQAVQQSSSSNGCFLPRTPACAEARGVTLKAKTTLGTQVLDSAGH